MISSLQIWFTRFSKGFTILYPGNFAFLLDGVSDKIPGKSPRTVVVFVAFVFHFVSLLQRIFSNNRLGHAVGKKKSSDIDESGRLSFDLVLKFSYDLRSILEAMFVLEVLH